MMDGKERVEMCFVDVPKLFVFVLNFLEFVKGSLESTSD